MRESIEEPELDMEILTIYFNAGDQGFSINELSSINIWAFDSADNCVWNGILEQKELNKSNPQVQVCLPENTYEFIVWGDIKDNPDFDLSTYYPHSKSDLVVKMKKASEEFMSGTQLNNLYHGAVLHTFAPGRDISSNRVTVPIVKDNHLICLNMKASDGKASDEIIFDISLSCSNGIYFWDNSLLESKPLEYLPWYIGSISQNSTQIIGKEYRFSTGRFMENVPISLVITRKSDGLKKVIPLLSLLLSVKEMYGDMANQQYLDNFYSWTIDLFYDKDSILLDYVYINRWKVILPFELTI